MPVPETNHNLMAAMGAPTLLPDDPAMDALAALGDREPARRDGFLAVVRQYPSSSFCWALLAEGSLLAHSEGGDVAAYAYARTGYHRGLDALRRHGWKGAGPVPWAHEANQGFLRCLWALTVASVRIGDQAEASRCAQFLRDSSEEAWQALSAHEF